MHYGKRLKDKGIVKVMRCAYEPTWGIENGLGDRKGLRTRGSGFAYSSRSMYVAG